MVGDPRRLKASDQGVELVQIVAAQWIGAAQIQRDSMQDKGRKRARPLQDVKRAATADHEILADYLEPIGPRAAVEDPPIMRRAQSDSVSDKRKVFHAMARLTAAAQRPVRAARYNGFFCWLMTVPPFEVHSWALLT